MKQKNLFIRVDSGSDIGLGHVMRCFALAEVIKNMNFNVYFISKEIEGNVIKNVENYGYKVFRIDSKAIKSSKSHWKMDAVKTTKIIQRFKNEKNLLLVDNYELSNMWETWLKLVVDKIIVIDDFLNIGGYYANIEIQDEKMSSLFEKFKPEMTFFALKHIERMKQLKRDF